MRIILPIIKNNQYVPTLFRVPVHLFSSVFNWKFHVFSLPERVFFFVLSAENIVFKVMYRKNNSGREQEGCEANQAEILSRIFGTSPSSLLPWLWVLIVEISSRL